MRISLVIALMTFASSYAAPLLNSRLATSDCLNASCDHAALSSVDPILAGKPSAGHSYPHLDKRMGGKKNIRNKNSGEKPLLDIQQEKYGDRRETKLARGVIGLVNFFGNSKVQQGIKDAFGKVKDAFVNWGKDENATRKALRAKKTERGGRGGKQ